jgi:hypothetical protein
MSHTYHKGRDNISIPNREQQRAFESLRKVDTNAEIVRGFHHQGTLWEPTLSLSYDKNIMDQYASDCL